MNSKDNAYINDMDVITDLIKIEGTRKELIKEPEDSILKFAVKEYTGNRFYRPINSILSIEEFFKINNYLCSIIRNLTES